MIPSARPLRIPAVFVLLAVALVWVQPARADRLYRGGVVATAHPLASEAALQMLNQGGNASDAAAAAAFVLAVVGPYHSGLGGGGFALIHEAKSGETRVLDFREVAPLGATRDMFVRDGKVVPGKSTDGALSVAVPGAALGYLELHKRYGKLPLKTVLAPAIRLARQGFWVTPKYRAIATARRQCLSQDPEASRIFLSRGAGGEAQVPEIGAVIRQPELARTLARVAVQGRAAVYAGKTAKAIVDTVQRNGGVLSLEDLKKFQVRWREPLVTSYRGHRIETMPPPSAGGLAIAQVLGALEKLEPTASPWHDPEHLHRFVESVRRVYVDRAKYLGDPAFTEIPMEKLTSPEAIARLSASIDPARATRSQTLLPSGPDANQSAVPHPEGWRPRDGTDGGRNTTHLSVLDQWGNAVALTTTVNFGFGSCLVAKGTGILLNDEMDDFAAQPMVPNTYGLVTGEANAIAPGKIPLSSMSPTLVYQKEQPDQLLLVVGSPGGSTIPTTVIQVIENVIDYGMDVSRAVGAGRVHHQYLPDKLLVDRTGMDPATRKLLEAKGHHLQLLPQWGDAEAVYQDPVTGLRSAASDPRNEGAPAGQD